MIMGSHDEYIHFSLLYPTSCLDCSNDVYVSLSNPPPPPPPPHC